MDIEGLTDPSGILSAVPFDAANLEVTGPARPIADKLASGNDGDLNLGVSRTGDLAYQISTRAGIRLVRVDRSGVAQDVGADSAYYYSPRVAPDGRHVALIRSGQDNFTTRDIWVLDLVQHTQSRVTFDTTAAWLAWSPDGRQLAYTRYPPAGSAPSVEGQLALVPADGSGAPRSLLNQRGNWRAMGFERGGRWLVYSGFKSPQAKEEIWRVSLDSGATPQQVLASSFDNGAPSLSPDGRWVAYVANESGRNEVYVRPYPGPGGRWQVSLDGGAEPTWSSAGNEIFYRTGDAMIAAAVRTRPAFEVTGRTTLFDAEYEKALFFDHNYGVAPDGKSFFMLRRVVGAQQAVVVTLNWFDQLRARQK